MNFQASESFHSESNLVRLKNSSLNKSDPSLNTSFVSLLFKQHYYIWINSSKLYFYKITISLRFYFYFGMFFYYTF